MKIRGNFFKKQPKSTFKLLQKRLEQHSGELLTELEEKHKSTLRWFSKKGINVDKVVKSGSKGAFAGLAAGVVLLSSGLAPNVGGNQPESSIKLDVNQIVGDIKARQVLEQKFINSFQQSLPRNTNNISEVEAEKIVKEIEECR